MERHFACTACGKCCQGRLPLTIGDALTHVDLFPLFIMWSPVRPGGKSYDAIRRIGLEIEPKKRKKAAVRVTPISYIPPHMPCPALLDDGLCAVHETKPLRCRAMPLSGARAECDQTDLLIPKAGWACDVSETAPVVYRNKTIVDRAVFAQERRALEIDAKILVPFAQFVLDAKPDVRKEVFSMALRPQGGQVITNFSHLIARLPQVDMFDFAAQQQAVMQRFSNLTTGKTEWASEHERYAACAKEYAAMLA